MEIVSEVEEIFAKHDCVRLLQACENMSPRICSKHPNDKPRNVIWILEGRLQLWNEFEDSLLGNSFIVKKCIPLIGGSATHKP